ncbi:MAG TPA: hypothetical protein VJA87_02310 [Candidatus Paceibacterota bacterium]
MMFEQNPANRSEKSSEVVTFPFRIPDNEGVIRTINNREELADMFNEQREAA